MYSNLPKFLAADKASWALKAFYVSTWSWIIDLSSLWTTVTAVNTPTYKRKMWMKTWETNWSNQYFTLPNTDTFWVAASNWSLSLFCNTDNFTTTGWENALYEWARNDSAIIYITMWETAIKTYRIVFRDNWATHAIDLFANDPLITINKWFMFSVTWNNTSKVLNFYCNWALINTATSASMSLTTASSVSKHELCRWAASRYFDGQCWNFMFWNRTLSQTETQELYYSMWELTFT